MRFASLHAGFRVFKKLGYPLASLVLALVLGDRAEDAFRPSMLLSQGNLGIFFDGSLAALLTITALVLLLWPLAASSMQRMRAARTAEA